MLTTMCRRSMKESLHRKVHINKQTAVKRDVFPLNNDSHSHMNHMRHVHYGFIGKRVIEAQIT